MRPVQIWGLGLMGLSLATGLIEAGFTVYGRDIDPDAEGFAAGEGVHIGLAPHPGWCVIAVPPEAFAGVLDEAMGHVAPDTVITDVTSVKGPVLPCLAMLPPMQPVVSSHPMAGNEQGGYRNFRRDLYRDRVWALIAVDHHPVPWRAMESLVRPLGARLTTLPAAEHDRIAAFTSHLPYLSALALSSVLERLPDQGRSLLGPGFLGATRTAMAPSGLWSQILAANHESVREALHALQQELAAWDEALAHASRPALEARIERVRRGRRRLSAG
jgi:prephenate dehydrogenase